MEVEGGGTLTKVLVFLDSVSGEGWCAFLPSYELQLSRRSFTWKLKKMTRIIWKI